MKRKITCMLLAVLMVISLLPFGASAASNFRASENVINLIKQFEGFSATAFWDVSQWSVGYGTTGYAGQTISEAEADLVLRSQLNTIDEKINQFTARNNLYLTQYQHDALVSFSFNCGTDWMTQGGRFFDAVTRGVSVNQFLFAISLWANAGTVPDSGLLNRRMAEANLYLNAVYSKAAPAAYTFVVLNPNGGTPGNNGEDKMQGYLSGSNVEILAAAPTKAGATFGGWFTSPAGGNNVKYLSAATAGMTLYAQYGVPCTVTSTYANVRNGAGTNYTQIATVPSGTQIVILETASVNGIQWGRFCDGWISLEYTNFGGQTVIPSGGSTTPTTTTGNATVSASSGVNIRSGAGMNYSVVGSAYSGQRINILETVNNNGTMWGRIGTNQWICMTYVRMDNGSSVNPGTNNTGVIWNDNNGETTHNSSATVFNGVVTGSGVNVRTGAGTNNPVVAVLSKGTRVTVYQQITKDNVAWGQIANGWICMNYVALEANSMNTNPGTSTTPSTPAGVIATGTVRTNTNLNVRTGPGTGYSKVGALPAGSAVNIYERTTVNGMEWGRIGNNQWVSLAYVNLTSSITVVPPTTGTSMTPATTGTGVVNTANLNIRSGAGTNYSKVGALTSGTRVSILEIAYVNGSAWGRIGTNQWVSMNYISMESTSTGSTTVTPSTGYITGVVTSNGKLNVRAGAGTNNAIVGGLASGTTVTITEVVSVNGSNWGRIANGWVSMNYIRVVSGNAAATGNVFWS